MSTRASKKAKVSDETSVLGKTYAEEKNAAFKLLSDMIKTATHPKAVREGFVMAENHIKEEERVRETIKLYENKTFHQSLLDKVKELLPMEPEYDRVDYHVSTQYGLKLKGNDDFSVSLSYDGDNEGEGVYIFDGCDTRIVVGQDADEHRDDDDDDDTTMEEVWEAIRAGLRVTDDVSLTEVWEFVFLALYPGSGRSSVSMYFHPVHPEDYD